MKQGGLSGALSALKRLQGSVVLAVHHLRAVLDFGQHRVARLQLRVQHVDRGQHALLPNRHGLIVEAHSAHGLQRALAHVVALHKVRLYRGDVVQLLQLDAVVLDGLGQEGVALRVCHRQVSAPLQRVLYGADRVHLGHFLVGHRLQVDRLFLHHHWAYLVFVEHARAPVKTVVLVRFLRWH